MPAVPAREILEPAFAQRYGVAAFNVADDLMLEAVIAAAVELDAPLIVGTALATVQSVGATILVKQFRARADEAPVPVAMHLDHCPERAWITTCLEAGWSSVLFDGSHLPLEENVRQTAEVVAEAHAHGAQVEGEIERFAGVEDGVGTGEAGEVHPVEVSSRFIAATGVDSFAPAVGTAHGLYAGDPELVPERVTELVALRPIPMVLHGGTGLSEAQFQDLIARGCAKVNISTALRVAYVGAHREHLAANPDSTDPAALRGHVRDAVQAVAARHIRAFGSAGKARAAGPVPAAS